MPNVISGVSSAALSREVFRIRRGEWYIISGTEADSLYLGRLLIGDGKDEVVVLTMVIDTPTVTNESYYGRLSLYEPPDYGMYLSKELYMIKGSPTYVTSGGLDRISLPSPFPYRLPFLGKLTLMMSNCTMKVHLLAYSHKYKNKARYDQGGKPVLGSNHQCGYSLGRNDRVSYTDSTVGEVDKSKLDLGAVFSIKKFATRAAHVITAAVAGSSFRCYSSEDDVEWTKIWETVDLPTEEAQDDIQVYDITARYIKFTLDANSVVETATLFQYPLFAWVEKNA